jgi:hypothetical protein
MLEHNSQKRKLNRPRRGVAVLVVLGLLAVTLAIGYSLMRTQATTAQLQGNGTRRGDARMAAQAGMAVALRKMHEDGWAGVTSTLSSKVGPHSGYVVSYQTGDAALTSSSADYAEYPFRVTITSQGYAEDPAHPGVQSQHTQSAVVQLVRRALGAEPAPWSALNTCSVFQWSNNDAVLQFPFRAEGDVCFLGKLRFWEGTPTRSDVKQRYLQDLNKMRLAGQADNRPFSGNMILSSRTNSDVLTTLQSDLGLTTYVLSDESNSAPILHPGGVSSYQLYPGGKSYSTVNIQAIYGSSLTGVVLGADPLTNPLGIFRSQGALTLNLGTKITGTIIANGGSSAVYIRGLLVELNAATLPALDGDSQAYQLPAALIQDDLRVYGGSGSKINGGVVVWDQYVLESGLQATSMTHTGRLLTQDFTVNGRTEWNLVDTVWNGDYTLYKLTGGIGYFPTFMQTVALLAMKPSLTISPDSSGVKCHWQDWSQPIYVKGATDEGLRWSLIRIQDGS